MPNLCEASWTKLSTQRKFFFLNKYLCDWFFINPTKNSLLRIIFQYFKNIGWYLEVIALYMWVTFHSDALLRSYFTF